MAKTPDPTEAHPIEKAMRDHVRNRASAQASGEAARQSLKGEQDLNRSMPLTLDVPAKKITTKPATGE